MRRSSIAAPLILILLGVIFLLRNLYPEIPLMEYLSRYWPFLLIFWGVLRLAEILFWAAASRPLPRFGVTSGEWLVIVFLCLFGASLHAARGISTWWPRGRFSMGGL